MVNVTVEDRIALHELAACYGDLIDLRDWEGLARVFTDDAVFDATDLGMPLLEGLKAIRDHMDKSANHPLGHHITNIYVEITGDEIILRSRIIAAGHRGRVSSASYRDRVVKTERGWRIRHRVCTLRRTWRVSGKAES
jgi:ketosteroid isomerase-like protein